MRQYFSKHRTSIILGVAVTLSYLWLLLTDATWIRTTLTRLDYLAYDLRLNLALPDLDKDNLRVVILDIDEASLRKEGRWPWSREKVGHLVEVLKRQGVRTLGFDIAFTEPERNIARELLTAAELQRKIRPEEEQFLEEMIPRMDRDQEFANQLKGQSVVLGVLFHAHKGKSTGLLPQPWVVLTPSESAKIAVPAMSSYTGNLSLLQEAASGGGFLNTTRDDDGVLRSSPLILRHDEGIYPSLALAMARLHKNALRFKIETTHTGDRELVTGLWLNRFHVPTDQYGRVLVPYLGKRGSFTYLSATDVLQSSDSDILPGLKGAAVIVGTSALGLSDFVSSPMQPAFPGVEAQASMLQALLSEHNFAYEPDWAKAANALLIILFGLILSLIGSAISAPGLAIVALSFIALLLSGNLWLWTSEHLSLSPVLPLATILSVITVNMTYGFFREEKQKRQVRHAFSHYLAPALVDHLVEDPAKLTLTGETRDLTFLFSDIAGFTAFTEKTNPEILVSLLNEYLDGMCSLVMSHGGTIDKIVGDAVHAIFNAPVDEPDHPALAVACALEMDRFSTDFIEKKHAEGLDFGITRIGINTGRAVVGNFGGSSRFDYTAHGDSINTAARMESVNKHLGTKICVSGSTVAHCPNHFFRPVGALVLKGKVEAIDAFEPITEEESRSTRIKNYVKAFECLERGEPEAPQLFSDLKAAYPDDPLVMLHCKRTESDQYTTKIILGEK